MEQVKEEKTKLVYVLENDANQLVFECPHCDMLILVGINEINCKIFRHGMLKRSGQQVNPHLKQDECERLVHNKQVYGCCKPFELVQDDSGGWKARICTYI